MTEKEKTIIKASAVPPVSINTNCTEGPRPHHEVGGAVVRVNVYLVIVFFFAIGVTIITIGVAIITLFPSHNCDLQIIHVAEDQVVQ